MAFWNRGKNWEDEYDEYYAQDRHVASTSPGRFWFVRHTVVIAAVASLFVGGVGVVSGGTMVEKLLTALASPLGLVWLGLMLTMYFCLLLRQGWPALACFVLWLLLTLGGNQLVSNQLALSLERPFLDLNPYEGEPFESIVVLGGGTNTTPSGRSQLTSDGDRIATAARMYHAGKTKQLICTGVKSFSASPQDRHPFEEATEVLVGLGVPRTAILQISGMNTSEEMKNLRQWSEQQDHSGRLGVITSAWHLPRAIRLAKAQGLTVEPVPSSFLSEAFSPSPALVVPGADSLLVSSKMLKEYLARLVGR